MFVKTTAVLFDFDMTLVDSVEAITYCLNRVAEDKGLPPVDQKDVFSTIGLPITEACLRLWGRCDGEWITWYGTHYREDEYARLELFPDARASLEGLRQQGVRTGVVSNRRYARRVVERLGLDPLCDVVLGLEDGTRGKPDPELLLRALERLSCAPENAWYVGDTDGDMRAARAAGMGALGISQGAFDAAALTEAGAHAVVSSLASVLVYLGYAPKEGAEAPPMR